jgi:hypothetical protein
MKNLYALFFMLLASSGAFAQLGGKATYAFLGLPTSARMTALAGSMALANDADPALAFYNPAFLNENMQRHGTFGTAFLMQGTDIYYGYAGYTLGATPWGMNVHAGIQFIRYGTFNETDETGLVTGEFRAAEYAPTIGLSHGIGEQMRVGINMKLIVSQLANYQSIGLATDLGGIYFVEAQQLAISLVARNVGAQLTTYEHGREPLPLDVQLGISKRLRHLPFRFTFVAHQLQQWDITYDDPNAEDDTALLLIGSEAPAEESAFSRFAGNLFRHCIFNGELSLGKNEVFQLRLGYNHLRRSELRVDGLRGMAGFSFGLGINTKRVALSYGHAFQHLAGSNRHFSLVLGFK